MLYEMFISDNYNPLNLFCSKLKKYFIEMVKLVIMS